MNPKGKLFTFGCSMTSYSWPTWADILGNEYISYENWGRGSAGNLFIFESIIECLEKNKITADDTVIILWSAITRMDYYQFGTWSSIVNRSILNANDNLVNCPDGYEIINYAYFAAIDRILTAAGIKYYMFKWCDYNSDTSAGKLYKNVLSKIQKLNFKISRKKIFKPGEYKIEEAYNQLAGTQWPPYSEIFNYEKSKYSDAINKEIDDKFFKYLNDNRRLFFSEETIDNHPTPLEHLHAIEKFFPVSDTTVKWITDIDNKVLRGIPFDFKRSNPERL
jgi:hypothetical protein